MLSAIFTLGIYVVGQFNAELKRFDAIVDSPAAIAVAKACYYVLPDFSRFDVKLAVVHGIPVPGAFMAASAAYWLAACADEVIATPSGARTNGTPHSGSASPGGRGAPRSEI